jgi:hypothetical protein
MRIACGVATFFVGPLRRKRHKEIPMSDNSPPYRPRCMHLNCKAMMVYGEAFESDPDFQAGLTDFWCQLTHKPNGPDEEEVSLDCCSDPQRGCFREF